jgi:uncharacterized protein (TIGR02145 family)
VWQSSNEFAVTVFNCSFSAGTATSATATFVDPRDGKSYKTVVMPDGKTWFAQNLNYTKDLIYNAYSYEVNGKPLISNENGGVLAIGSYWCPPLYWVNGTSTLPVASGSEADCRTYGALYTWETAMMVDGKYADDTKASSAWDESWVSGNYYVSGAPGSTANAAVNNARNGRGICPKGWHVPTAREWAYMLDKVEGDGTGSTFTNQPDFGGWWGADAGQKLKSSGTFTTTDPGDGSWYSHSCQGSDSYGFATVPAGVRALDGSYLGSRGVMVRYWTSNAYASKYAFCRGFYYDQCGTYHDNHSRSSGFAVRCIKD